MKKKIIALLGVVVVVVAALVLVAATIGDDVMTKKDGVYKGFPCSFMIFSPVSLADKNGISRGHTIGQSHDHEHYGSCGTNSCQSIGRYVSSNDHCIYHVVKLLEYKSKKNRNNEFK